jgi:hypothetical protein
MEDRKHESHLARKPRILKSKWGRVYLIIEGLPLELKKYRLGQQPQTAGDPLFQAADWHPGFGIYFEK